MEGRCASSGSEQGVGRVSPVTPDVSAGIFRRFRGACRFPDPGVGLSLAPRPAGGTMGRWTPARREDCWRASWWGLSSRRWARSPCSVSLRTKWRGGRWRTSCGDGWRRRRRARRPRCCRSSCGRSAPATRSRSPTPTCGASWRRRASGWACGASWRSPPIYGARRHGGGAGARRRGVRARRRPRRDCARRRGDAGGVAAVRRSRRRALQARLRRRRRAGRRRGARRRRGERRLLGGAGGVPPLGCSWRDRRRLGVLALTVSSRGASRGRSCGSPTRRRASGAGSSTRRSPIETRDEIGFLAPTLDETRAALKARDERLQMMLAGIAHEVRNPLGGLELYAGLLRDALAGSPSGSTRSRASSASSGTCGRS